MAGKTGTAQVRVYSQEEHLRGMTKNASLDWKLRDHGLFIGFAPVVDPKYAIVCIVEHGSDGHPQVQMARDILLFAQQRDPLEDAHRLSGDQPPAAPPPVQAAPNPCRRTGKAGG